MRMYPWATCITLTFWGLCCLSKYIKTIIGTFFFSSCGIKFLALINMLSTLQNKALHNIQILFFYLPQLPVEWNLSESKIIASPKSRSRWFPFRFMLGLNIIIFTGNIFVSLTHGILTKRLNYFAFHLAFHVLGGSFNFMTVYTACVLCKQSSIVQSVNQFLELQKRLSAGKSWKIALNFRLTTSTS